MASGHGDFAGFVQLYGEWLDSPKQVAFGPTGDVQIVWVDLGAPANPHPQYIQSIPPVGHWKIINMYVDANTGKLVIEYETG